MSPAILPLLRAVKTALPMVANDSQPFGLTAYAEGAVSLQMSQAKTEAFIFLIHIHMNTNIIRGDAEIRNFLEAKIEAGGIAAVVAREALYDPDVDVIAWFEGLLQHGCVSGWASNMIWYSDTHAFFDEHYDEIEELREDWAEEV